MDIYKILELLVQIAAGIAVCVPLVVQLVKYVQKAGQEKNWAALLGLVMTLIETAEEKFSDGATRKDWVMAMVLSSAEYINYPMDKEALSQWIDSLVELTNKVNSMDAAQLKEEEVEV